jgi:hypothetical protein
VAVASKKNGPIGFLEDRTHHSDSACRLTSNSSVTPGFSVPTVHTVVPTDGTFKFKSGFIRPNNEIRRRFSFIAHAQKTTHEIPFDDLDRPHSLHA